jgi:hypothetical protein
MPWSLFIARSDKRIASLGQLCVGLAWIDYWGLLVLESIKTWLLPIEAGFAYFPLLLFGSFSLEGVIICNTHGFAIKVIEGLFGISQYDHHGFYLAVAGQNPETGFAIEALCHFGDWSCRCRCAEHCAYSVLLLPASVAEPYGMTNSIIGIEV